MGKNPQNETTSQFVAYNILHFFAAQSLSPFSVGDLPPCGTGALAGMLRCCQGVLGRGKAHEEQQGALVHVGPGVGIVALQVLVVSLEKIRDKRSGLGTTN